MAQRPGPARRVRDERVLCRCHAETLRLMPGRKQLSGSEDRTVRDVHVRQSQHQRGKVTATAYGYGFYVAEEGGSDDATSSPKVGFGLQRSMAVWTGIKIVALRLGAGPPSLWLVELMACGGVCYSVGRCLWPDGSSGRGYGAKGSSDQHIPSGGRLGVSPLSATCVALSALSAVLFALSFCSGFRISSQPAPR